ncbi:MAG: ROK family protein [Bacteroidales bacterium]|nr:ROK family protein [Bacteroidales bacterium]
MTTYLCVELSGAKLLIGEVDENGNILQYKSYASFFFNQQSALGIIKASLDDYINTIGFFDKKPVAMGVGLLGRVDTANGIWLQIDPNRSEPITLAKDLEELYGIPCHIDNDVKSATRAERLWGAGKYSKNFVYIYVGTGIAVGTVINGRQVRGSHFNAGEAGHMTAGVSLGVKCDCGRMDCVEAIASEVGFDRCARLFSHKYETKLTISKDEGDLVNVDEVISLSRQGDPLCVFLVENAVEAIANLIMNMVRVTDPDTVVLGGEIFSDGYIYDKVLWKLHPATMRFVTQGVMLTKLDPKFIGLLGAAAVAMDK